MTVTEFEVEGYRSLKHQSWQPSALNLVIGPNASGKSNLLQSLELLSVAARGGLGDWVKRQGGIEPIVWDGSAEQISLKVRMTPFPPYYEEKDGLTYQLVLARLGQSSAYRIGYELLGNFHKVETGEMQEPFKLLERDPRHAVVFSMESQRFEAAPESVPEDEALLSVAAGPFTANKYVGEVQREFASWRVYQGFETGRESTVRGPQVTRNETAVTADGQNLISVLHTLYTGNREFKHELNEALRAATAHHFRTSAG